MRYRIGLARDGCGLQATVFDLPGCAMHAPNDRALHELLPVVIAEHVSWLARHGEGVDGACPIETEIAEEVGTATTGAADGEFCFAHDERPIASDELERVVRWMSFATADLLALVDPLPDAVLDWRPPTVAMARVDEWQPGVKAIREIAQELPGSERYYRLGLSEAPQADEPDNVVFDRRLQRELTIKRLRSLTDEERGKTFLVTRPWQDRPERWTARKVVRRIISHERFHTKEIEQRLSWLLLGVPDFTKARQSAEGATVHD